MKVKFFFRHGGMNRPTSDEIDLPDDTSDSEIETMLGEWAMERVDFWSLKEDEEGYDDEHK